MSESEFEAERLLVRRWRDSDLPVLLAVYGDAEAMRWVGDGRAITHEECVQWVNNCFKNGLLPVVLKDAEVDRIFHDVAAFPGFRLTVDLAQQVVAYPDASRDFRFEIDPFRKHCLLNGLDEIGLTLRHADKIRTFEARRKAEQPWLFG